MKKLLVFVLFVSLSLACVSCNKGAQTQGQILKYNMTQEPQFLDPGKATGIPEFTVLLNLFDGLTRYDQNHEIKPSIAEKWEGPSQDHIYTFHLRKDMKWSNGDPVTAHDFEYSWKRALSPELASEYAYQLYYLKKGKDLNSAVPAENQSEFSMENKYYYPKLDENGEVLLDADGHPTANTELPLSLDDLGVKALDDYTLEVQLEAETPFFLSLLTFTTYLPVNAKVVSAHPDWAKSTENFVSNGPFKITEWKHAEKIIVQKNENYWDKDAVNLSEIQFLMIDNQTTELAMWESGALDFATNPPPIEFERLKKENKLQIQPYLGTYYYAFNTRDRKSVV